MLQSVQQVSETATFAIFDGFSGKTSESFITYLFTTLWATVQTASKNQSVVLPVDTCTSKDQVEMHCTPKHLELTL